MNRRMLMLLSFFLATNSYAQEFKKINHLEGMQVIDNNAITVTPRGKAKMANHCNVGPYLIGNNKLANHYSFTFRYPVDAVLLNFSAINLGEIIKVKINGADYALTAANRSASKAECTDGIDLSIENGAITNYDEHVAAKGAIVINANIPIASLSVEHMNGLNKGSVFSVSFVNDLTTATSISNTPGGSLFDVYPNPSNGRFEVAGTGFKANTLSVELLNAMGQIVYTKEATPVNGVLSDQVAPNTSLPSGVYHVQVKDGDAVFRRKLLIVN